MHCTPCSSQGGYPHPVPQEEDDVLSLLVGVHSVDLIKKSVLGLLLPVLLCLLNIRVVGTSLSRPFEMIKKLIDITRTTSALAPKVIILKLIY